MKKYLILFIFILIFNINSAFAAVIDTAGFIPGQIWYSKENPNEGEKINIYTVVWNGGGNDLTVRIEFYDKNVILGTRDIVIQKEQIKEVSIPWKVTAGDHVISARIVSSTIALNGKKEDIKLINSITTEDHKFIPAVIKNVNGDSVTSSDLIKNEVSITTAKISDFIPNSVSESVTKNVDKIENFRDATLIKINYEEDHAKKELINFNNLEGKGNESLNTDSFTKTGTKTSVIVSPNKNLVEKPLTYLKIYTLTLCGYIFSHKVIFYGLLIIILFNILRFVYHKIKYR